MIESFVFAFNVYAVNGYATQANASVAASRPPPKRKPTRARPSRVSRSKTIAVACAVGSVSHFPLHPNTRNAGMYAA
jgi:hypothetical protein